MQESSNGPSNGRIMRPLADIRVLAVTVFLAGPFCSMSLARLGAEVIKVEVPGRGDPTRGNGPFAGPDGTHPAQQSDKDIGTQFLKRTQGVKSVTLNLKHPEGRQMFLDLAKTSDVVLENLAPGSMKRMGLGYEDVSLVNPRVVYCSISGYGQTGPYSSRPAHDPQVQGMSGIMDINGDPDGPATRVGFYISDLVTPVFACYSITAALRHRDRTGEGQYLDASMMDTLAALMFMENVEEDIENGVPLRKGNFSRSGPTGLYHAKDGDVTLTAASDDQWGRLCRALDAEDLMEDPRFADHFGRTSNVGVLREELQEIVGRMTREEALERMDKHDVPCGPVRTVPEVMADQHFWDRETLLPLRHGHMDEAVPGLAAGFPVLFSGGSLPELAGAPTLGMHNEEVYRGLLDLDQDDLDRLKEEGVL